MKDENSFKFTAVSLCLVFIGVYAYQVFTGFNPGFNTQVSPWWKFFTSIFGHSDVEHLFNNVFFIGLFGSVFELLTSRRKLLEVFLVSALFANLSAFFFFQGSYLIGASGGGMGILAALAVYRPNKIGLALGVPLPMWAVLIVYVLINILGISANTSVAYEAHLLGLVAGSLMGYGLRERPYLESGGDREDWRERIRKWEEEWMM
ncbi:MAG: rhomboid family intramembrane serine protease [Candidatus Nanohaloarchaea archaeon]